jgi:hypothetical protein
VVRRRTAKLGVQVFLVAPVVACRSISSTVQESVGADDPLQAVGDVLTGFPVDEIVA